MLVFSNAPGDRNLIIHQFRDKRPEKLPGPRENDYSAERVKIWV